MSRKIALLTLAALLTGMAIAGCSSSDSTPPPAATAKFRVVHASPDAGPVDVYIGASLTPWLEDVAYTSAGVYLSRNTGTIQLVVREAGVNPTTDPGVVSDPIDLTAGASLTILIAGQLGSSGAEDAFRFITYSDNFQNSPAARTRVVHAGSDAPSVQVSVAKTSQVLAPNLARWEESGRAGNVYETGEVQDIVVQAADHRITTFRAPALEAQKDYYFFLIGLISDPGAATAPFDLLIVGPGGVLPLEATTPRNFRLVHALPDGDPVDPYLVYGFGDGFVRIKIMDDLRYGGATAYKEAKVRQVFLEFYPVGADPDLVDPLDSRSVHIHDEAGSTTIFAAGLAGSVDPEDEIRLFSLADHFEMGAAGYMTARVVHACPNQETLEIDFGNDGSPEATAERFSGNPEGSFSLLADTAWTMVVRDVGTTNVVDVFVTQSMAADTRFYLVLTGIKDGSPGFALLSVNEDGAQGFTAPN